MELIVLLLESQFLGFLSILLELDVRWILRFTNSNAVLVANLPLDLARCDAALYRTYIQAEVASYAVVVQFRFSLLLVPVDCLVSSVVAGDVASNAGRTLYSLFSSSAGIRFGRALPMNSSRWL